MNILKTTLMCYLFYCLIELGYSRKTRHRLKKRRLRGFRQENRPNIILILADDLDVALGSPDAMKKTKKLLREGGTDFVNTFVTSSICCPSRSSILTGKYSHNHFINSNRGNCSSTSWQRGAERNSYGRLLQDAGYITGYFGKYLNGYDGSYIPPGWNEWYGQLKNSRYYNYTVNNNGRLLYKGGNYERDYSTNVYTDAAARFFRRTKARDYRKPIMMTVSYAAPHGSEDPAPQHSELLPDAKAPRHPSYNLTSMDKHWIVRRAPPISNEKKKFIDQLHRRRLLTLLSLDDAIARLYQTVRRMRALENTYIFFSSDHGYHLGQFRLVKGKSQPYDTDIRVPLYVIGPGVAVNKTEKAIALNIDLVPTFLDIAGAHRPDYIDGSSLLSVLSAKKKQRRNKRGLPITPWRDTFLVERTRMNLLLPLKSHNSENFQSVVMEFASKLSYDPWNEFIQVKAPFISQPRRMNLLPFLPDSHPVINRQKITRVDAFTQLYTRLKVASHIPDRRLAMLLCTRSNAPKPPCTSYKRRICVMANGKFSLVECPVRGVKSRTKDAASGLKCVCKPKPKPTFVPTNPLSTTLSPAKLELLRRRVYASNHREYYRKLGELADLPDDEADLFAKLLVRMKRKYKKRSLRRLTLRDLKYNEISLRIREAKKRLGLLRQRKRLLRNPSSMEVRIDRLREEKKDDKICTCVKKEKPKVVKKSKKKKRKSSKLSRKEKKKLAGGGSINCFFVDKNTWKTPPRWTGGEFLSCTNTANNSYWCLRTINATHNFIYCKFVTNFHEYYDMNKDPYQTKNTYKSLSGPVLLDLDRQLKLLVHCKGERECTLTASHRPKRIVRPAIRRSYILRRYSRGRYIDWGKYLGLRSR